MSRKQFWARLVLYILFGAILPFIFLVWRFELFQKVSGLSVGGWGLIGIIFVAVFLLKLMKAVRKGLPFSLGTQVLEGVCKIIFPFLIAAVCVYVFKDMMDELFQFLCVVIICEMVAIPLNPIPQWAHENKIEEQTNGVKTMFESLGIIEKTKK